MIFPPGKIKLNLPTYLVVLITDLKQGYEHAPLSQIREEELVIMKKTYNQEYTENFNDMIYVNNKQWWQYGISVKVNKKKTANFHLLRTLHNGKVYTIKFEGEGDSFDKNVQEAMLTMATFMFHSSDKTVYTGMPAAPDIKLLTPFYGTYKAQPTEETNNIRYSLIIGPTGAREIREQDGKTAVFEATLQPEIIDGNNLTLSSDAVYRWDTTLPYRKTTYILKKDGPDLKGTILAKDSSVKPRHISLVRNSQGPVAEEQPTVAKEEDNTNDDLLDEPQNIRKAGEGKVKRVSKKQLVIKLTTGKEITLVNTGEGESMAEYVFVGNNAELNSYVIYVRGWESGGYILVNKSNGTRMDLPSMNYFLSPDKKYLAIYNNDIISQESESCVTIYLITPTAFRKVFEKITFNIATNKGWAPTSLTWVNNTTIQIEKAVLRTPGSEELIATGRVWFREQDGKWVESATDAPEFKRPPAIAKTPDELGRIVFNAIKNNDAKTYIKYISASTEQEAAKAIDNIRKGLEQVGLADWKQTVYSRVTYGKDSFVKEEGWYTFYKIEFTYGKDFIGIIDANLNSGTISYSDNKCYLIKPLNRGYMGRRDVQRL